MTVPRFLDLLDEPAREQLHAIGREVRSPRGAALMYPGQDGESVQVLLEGHVKIVAPGRHGREALLGFREPGDLLGELAIVDGRPRGSGVMALEAVRSLVVAATDFRALLRREPDVAMATLTIVSERLRDADAKRSEHLAGDGIGRVAARLVELAERFGEQVDGGVRVRLPITQVELAGWSGTSVETVGRAMAQLRGLGWITTDRRAIVVREPDALLARGRT